MAQGCEVREGTWAGYAHWSCAPCGFATTDEAVYLQRCRARAPQGRIEQPLTSSTGLLGPDGQALPVPETPEAPSPRAHDDDPVGFVTDDPPISSHPVVTDDPPVSSHDE